MPGILPMKVIKVGTSAQSRIAQACDRCRSKKIRCDGITPCCTQCSNVGFACKTSDKLSRRAFPRGYTESLEERVRALESEVKELKDLLDEKDEKIDILSKIHAGSRSNSSTSAPQVAVGVKPGDEELQPEEDSFRVQQYPCLLEAENPEPYFMGASSGRSFVDAFKTRVQESGKLCGDFKTEAFFAIEKTGSAPRGSQRRSMLYKAPPRLISDQMINVYFQEWAPLFPVIHRPTFLNLYADYMTNPESIKDQHVISQLYLIFGIAALSAEGNKQSMSSFDEQWQSALGIVLSEQSLPTLQCLVLAQLYCIASADYKKLLHYKGMAVSLSHRLGLHQSQKRFALGALTAETRKKVFWTLYTLDCFSAALLGLPKLLKDGDIFTEFPADVDDENVSERGFQSTLPGESTRLSSALALFRAARIMSTVLDVNYPAAASYELSLQKIAGLSNKLDNWHKGLPSHLRLQFVQDKPSTNVVGSRSPLLSLAYYYIRTLIHRPAVGSSLGAKAGSSMVALANSSKHIIQIVQLLEERRMSFSICLNKNELLLLAGFGLLYQGLELDRKRKLIQDSHRLMCSVIEILERKDAPGAAHFKRIACVMISVDRHSRSAKPPDDTIITRRKSENKLSAPKIVSRSPRKQLQAIASRFASVANPPPLKRESTWGSRSTIPDVATYNPAIYARNDSQNSVSSVVSDPTHMIAYHKVSPVKRFSTDAISETPNLDYLSFSNEQVSSTDYSSIGPNSTKDMDPNHLTGFNTTQPVAASFSGLLASPDIMSAYISPSPSANHDWASETWALPTHTGLASARSVPSFSEEEITSGEELSSCDPACEFRGMTMPSMETANGLDALDGDSACDMLTPAFGPLG